MLESVLITIIFQLYIAFRDIASTSIRKKKYISLLYWLHLQLFTALGAVLVLLNLINRGEETTQGGDAKEFKMLLKQTKLWGYRLTNGVVDMIIALIRCQKVEGHAVTIAVYLYMYSTYYV